MGEFGRDREQLYSPVFVLSVRSVGLSPNISLIQRPRLVIILRYPAEIFFE